MGALQYDCTDIAIGYGDISDAINHAQPTVFEIEPLMIVKDAAGKRAPAIRAKNRNILWVATTLDSNNEFPSSLEQQSRLR